MKRPLIILIAWLITAAVLTAVGFLWQSYDMNKIRDINYTKWSQLLTQLDSPDMDYALMIVENSLKDVEAEILGQYQPAGSIREIVAQSRRNWLESNYYIKYTVVDAVLNIPSQPDSTARKMLVFEGYIETGSKAYLSIVLLCALLLLVFTVKSEGRPLLKISSDVSEVGQPSFLKDRHLLSVFIVALALRLGYMLVMLSGMEIADIGSTIHDSSNYLNAAQYILGNNESGRFDLYMVGPGYASLLALLNIVFGSNLIPLLFLQILMGSLSCVFIYKMGELLTGNRTIALVAGLIAAMSITGITLSSAILSETQFFFLFSLGLLLWFRGLQNDRWKYYLLTGVIFGLAVLTRAVLIYFPVVIVALALLYRFPATKARRNKRYLQTMVTVFLMLVISFAWGIRNKAVYETFTISGTGQLAAKLFLANKALIEAKGRHINDFAHIRDSLYQEASSRYKRGAYAEAEKSNRQFVLNAFKNHPHIFLKTYFMTVLKNITAISSIQHLHLPQYSDFLDQIDQNIYRGYHNSLVLVFSLTGLVLAAGRNIRIALILLLVTGYFALLSGVTFAQGSRIFFPAIVTQSILVSITLLFFYDTLRQLWTIIRSSLKSQDAPIKGD